MISVIRLIAFTKIVMSLVLLKYLFNRVGFMSNETALVPLLISVAVIAEVMFTTRFLLQVVIEV